MLPTLNHTFPAGSRVLISALSGTRAMQNSQGPKCMMPATTVKPSVSPAAMCRRWRPGPDVESIALHQCISRRTQEGRSFTSAAGRSRWPGETAACPGRWFNGCVPRGVYEPRGRVLGIPLPTDRMWRCHRTHAPFLKRPPRPPHNVSWLWVFLNRCSAAPSGRLPLLKNRSRDMSRIARQEPNDATEAGPALLTNQLRAAKPSPSQDPRESQRVTGGSQQPSRRDR